MLKAHHSATTAFLLAIVALLLCLGDLLFAQAPDNWPPSANWPQFRGPGARGVANAANLPDRWSATDNIPWKTEVPGRAWSSPIVWGDRVFLTAAVNSGDLESPKKGLYFGGNRPDPREVQLDYKVLCLDLLSGKAFCLNEDGVTFVLRAGDKYERLHTNELADGDMCPATPAIAGNRLLIRTSQRVYCVRRSDTLPTR